MSVPSIFYKYLGDLKYFQDRSSDYINELGTLFDSLNVKKIHKHFMSNVELIIRRMDQISRFIKRKLDYNLLEFKDCIYFAEYNQFLKRKEAVKSVELMSSVTIRYYAYEYSTVNFRKPVCWLSKINQHFISRERLADFAADFGTVLFQFPEESKSKSIFLLGRSGTGKTGLVTKSAVGAYGDQNVGSIVSEDLKFSLSNALHKDFISVDEVTYSKRFRSTLLKITGREKVIVNRKYMDAEFTEVSQMIIFSGNPSGELESMLSDEAFLKRINLYLFEREVSISENERRKIEAEIPLILIYTARARYQAKFSTPYFKKQQFKRFKQRYLTPGGVLTPQNPSLIGPTAPDEPPKV